MKSAPSSAAVSRSASSRGAQVLLLDGDEDSREMYLEFLTSVGFVVLALVDGHGATDVAAASQVDIVVTEVRLLGAIDGIEVTRRLRTDRRTKCIPVIVLTASTHERVRTRAKDAGGDRFLEKPCTPAELVAEIRDLLAADTGRNQKDGRKP